MTNSASSETLTEARAPFPPRSEWFRLMRPLAVLLVVTAVLYIRAIHLPFMAESYVEFDKAATHSPLEFLLTSAHLEKGEGVYYRPGWRFVDWAVMHLFPGGKTAAGNFVFQLLEHLMAVSLMYVLLLIMSGFRVSCALVAAAILALHPSISGSVIYFAGRWSLTGGLLFLLAAVVVEWTFAKRDNRLPAVPFIVVSFVLFAAALISEMGALAMGVIGVWVLIRWWQRKETGSFSRCLLPLAWVPVVYLLLRRLAIGHFAAPYIDLQQTPFERLRVTVHNIVYDVGLALEPLTPFVTSTGSTRVREVGILVAGLVVVCLLLAPRSSRRLLIANPMPFAGLLLFVVFQWNALWTVPKPLFWVFGIDRGYVYYFPATLCAIAVGLCVCGWADSRPGMKWLTVAFFAVWTVAASIQTHRSINLWMEGGDMMKRHEEALRPVLSKLPDKSAVHLQGFPDAIRAPHLPWALTYYFAARPIMETWAGKRLDVSWDLKDGNRADFEGLYLREGNGRLEVLPINAAELASKWNSHVETRAAVPPTILLDPSRGYAGGVLVERLDDCARLIAEGNDPVLGFEVDINPADYGYLRGEIMLEEIDPKGPPLTLQLFFSSPESPQTESRSFVVPLEGRVGEWQRIEEKLYQTPAWVLETRITHLRLDPVNWKAKLRMRGMEVTGE